MNDRNLASLIKARSKAMDKVRAWWDAELLAGRYCDQTQAPAWPEYLAAFAALDNARTEQHCEDTGGPMTATTLDTAATIRQLNDDFRRTLTGGRVMLTASVAALSADQQRAIMFAVRTFDDFDTYNDPHGEHDFGGVMGDRYFWKIDYYDADMEHGADDPADPAKTVRVMTIMQADEY